jgi:hypothetical protein
MEKTKFKEKIDTMIPSLSEAIRKECDRLFDSGGIDTSKEREGDYVLPKMILTIAIENQASQYIMRNPSMAHKKELSNLRHF